MYRVGWQIAEQIRAHDRISKQAARARAAELLAAVGIPQAGDRVDSYPHEFSGGMRQRVMIAMAVSCNPDVLIADEPTTALDVTIQAQILDLLRRLQAERGMAVLLITDDLGVVAELCHRVAIIYAGRIVEMAPVASIFSEPLHPYPRGLLRCLPHPSRFGQPLSSIDGAPPDLRQVDGGCRFAPRCPLVQERCRHAEPALAERKPGHVGACPVVTV